MARRMLALGALLALVGASGSAQDARAVLQASAAAMGLNNVKTIQYSATGWNALVGQSHNLSEDWPRFEVTSYTRVIDYDANTSREEFTRRRGNYPMRGGGAPFDGDQRVVQIVSGGVAWNLQGEKPVPPGRPYLEVMPHNELRQLEIILTPHGFLKAAMAAKDVRVLSTAIVGPTNAGLTENGRRATLVAFTALGKYKVVGAINDKNLVELTTTWIPNAVYGDMLYEIRHLNYKDFGGVQFPATIHVHQGDPVLNPAHNMMEIRVSNVQTNVAVPAMSVPEDIRKGPAAPPIRAEAQKLADGVWLIAGGSHHSVAVEFADHIAMIEAPLNEERSIAVLDAVAKVIPKKLVRYIVNTHHHFDHSSGLRTYIAQGSTLVTHRDNADFYEHVMFHPAPRTLMPDRLAMFYPNFTTSRRPVPIERVNQKYVLSDGTRTLELYPMLGSTHIGPMLIAYLPKEKILVNADMYTPPAPGAQVPSQAMQGVVALANNIQRLRLDVAMHATLHGNSPSPHEAFLKLAAAAKAGTN
ncbi:MAG: MBL fold metallo-hydrolase [Acidobacteria bacterium]|nr:MBL fold metallo-hydrolase [Acidobacteriota bacterium]